jgi:hypothetical protein
MRICTTFSHNEKGRDDTRDVVVDRRVLINKSYINIVSKVQ